MFSKRILLPLRWIRASGSIVRSTVAVGEPIARLSHCAHKDDTAAQLVHAVLTNTQMWDQDLTKIEGLEAAVLADLEKIRTEGAEAAYKSCL